MTSGGSHRGATGYVMLHRGEEYRGASEPISAAGDAHRCEGSWRTSGDRFPADDVSPYGAVTRSGHGRDTNSGRQRKDC